MGEIPVRDRVRKKASEPLTLGQTLKLFLAISAAVGIIWGAGATWSKMETTTKITDATTLEKLRAIEDKHEKDIHAQQVSHEKDHLRFELVQDKFDKRLDDYHDIQVEQTVILKRIDAKLDSR